MDTELKEVDKNSLVKLCKKCNNKIENNRRIFCSDRCAKAFYALIQYHKIKSTPEYKESKRLYRQKVKIKLKGGQQQDGI
jgi:predicted amidophosphoribosyltransferase